MKRENWMLCEAFEVSPSEYVVMKMPDPLICSYPGLVVEMPNEVFDDGDFQFELANVLCRPNTVDSDSFLPSPADPQYIHALLNFVLQRIGRTLLTNIWRGGRTADDSRIIKHVRDHIGQSWNIQGSVRNVWRRSPLWLLIRVAIQMTVNRSLGCASYKCFILFLMCTLAMDRHNTSLSRGLLHLMSSRILWRLSKLGSFTSD
jgi:hypothetical protein